MRTAILVSAVMLLAACNGTDANDDILHRMTIQPKYVWYGSNELFADGRAMRVPPEGTVPRERLRTLAIESARAENGAYLADIPVPVTQELIEKGRKHFNITCATCHGILGDGESMVARNMALRPPPNLHLPQYQNRPAGYYYDVITNGFGLMAAYSNEIPVTERWGVVAYMRALQLSQSATLDKVPADQRQKLEAAP
jgi:mono/diheme cytochrome c family protein